MNPHYWYIVVVVVVLLCALIWVRELSLRLYFRKKRVNAVHDALFGDGGQAPVKGKHIRCVMTKEEWKEKMANGKIVDLSHELPSGSANHKVQMNGVTYYAVFWNKEVQLTAVDKVIDHHANHGTEYP